MPRLEFKANISYEMLDLVFSILNSHRNLLRISLKSHMYIYNLYLSNFKISDNIINSYIIYVIELYSNDILPYGLVVRIPAFHAGGPGSIPGVGTFLLLFTLLIINLELP